MSKMYRLMVSSFMMLMLLTSHSVAAGYSKATAFSECTPYAVLNRADSFPEVQGKSDVQTVWALLFPNHLPIWIDEDVKIVWRMTGSGAFSLTAQHPDGTTINPIWGPEEHGGSSWDRPGEEWGTGLRFPKAGCWRVVVQRGSDLGEVDLLVVDPRLEFF